MDPGGGGNRRALVARIPGTPVGRSADALHGLASGPDIAARELARVTRPGGLVALFFWSSQCLLPGHAALESRLEGAFADTVPYMRVPSVASFQFALGWLRRARLTDLAARTFVADVQGPLDAEHKDALASAYDMLWTPLAPAVGAGDRDELARSVPARLAGLPAERHRLPRVDHVHAVHRPASPPIDRAAALPVNPRVSAR